MQRERITYREYRAADIFPRTKAPLTVTLTWKISRGENVANVATYIYPERIKGDLLQRPSNRGFIANPTKKKERKKARRIASYFFQNTSPRTTAKTRAFRSRLSCWRAIIPSTRMKHNRDGSEKRPRLDLFYLSRLPAQICLEKKAKIHGSDVQSREIYISFVKKVNGKRHDEKERRKRFLAKNIFHTTQRRN